MRKILTIYDIYEAKNKGIVLAGVNNKLDTFSTDRIRKLIDGEVLLKSSQRKDLHLKVLGLDVSSSIIGKKNIFILVEADDLVGNFNDYLHGEVYTVK